MKKLLIIILLLCTATQFSMAQYAGGEGTEEEPYQISTAKDLVYLSNTKEDWNNYFILIADISFPEDETTFDWDGDGTADWDESDTLGFLPIGNRDYEFTGNFDGKKHTISNLYIERPEVPYVGLFGWASTAIIKNLGIIDCEVNGDYNVGGIVGHGNNIAMSNCYSTGKVRGDRTIGGLIGECRGSNLNNCYSAAKISGAGHEGDGSFAGGLTGSTSGYSTITDSYATGKVIGNAFVGGFTGLNKGGEIRRCYATGNVEGKNSVGGFVGSNDSESTIISNCYSRGNVTRRAGSSSYNVEIGGFSGYHLRAVTEHCYSTGLVKYFSGKQPTDKGFIGHDNQSHYTYIDNFFDTQTSGQDSSLGATPKSTTAMKTLTTFTDVNWDFTNIWSIDPDINDGYPYLSNCGVGIIEDTDTETATSDFLIYPNPASAEITIDYEGIIESIEIYNIIGQLVMTADRKEINISNLPCGTYQVIINTGNTAATQQLIIER